MGFDCPRLAAMFVDKPLDGIAAVQTLSRLNRWFPGKSVDDLLILDFANEEESIMGSFDRFIDRRVTTPRNFIPRLEELSSSIRKFGLFSDADVDAFWSAARTDAAALYAVMGPLKLKVSELDAPERKRLVALLSEFKELYAIGSKLNPDALKHQRLAGFVSRMLTTVDKREALKTAGLPLKVVMASVVPYLPEDKPLFDAAAGAEQVVNTTAEPKEAKSPAKKALDGLLQELSVQKLEGLSEALHDLINKMCGDPKLITQARSNTFEVFANGGSAPAELTRLVVEHIQQDKAVGMALLTSVTGISSRQREVRENILRVVYTRCQGETV